MLVQHFREMPDRSACDSQWHKRRSCPRAAIRRRPRHHIPIVHRRKNDPGPDGHTPGNQAAKETSKSTSDAPCLPHPYNSNRLADRQRRATIPESGRTTDFPSLLPQCVRCLICWAWADFYFEALPARTAIRPASNRLRPPRFRARNVFVLCRSKRAFHHSVVEYPFSFSYFAVCNPGANSPLLSAPMICSDLSLIGADFEYGFSLPHGDHAERSVGTRERYERWLAASRLGLRVSAQLSYGSGRLIGMPASPSPSNEEKPNTEDAQGDSAGLGHHRKGTECGRQTAAQIEPGGLAISEDRIAVVPAGAGVEGRKCVGLIRRIEDGGPLAVLRKPANYIGEHAIHWRRNGNGRRDQMQSAGIIGVPIHQPDAIDEIADHFANNRCLPIER